MPLRPNMQPQEYVAILLRRKWLIIFSFLFILLGASIYCVVTPELFKSSTTILIIPQSVPQDYVRTTISSRVEEQLATIRQQVLSRTTLMKVMEELGLFTKERKNMAAEDVVEMMRKRIEIVVVEGRRRDSSDAFTLSFVNENRQMAMLTASRLASFFIDENLKVREQQAVGTSEFLEFQLKETKAKLEAQETRVKDYKMRFMGELPQQMEANLRMLTGLQDRLRSNGDNIRTQEDRKVFREAQVKILEAAMQGSRLDNGTSSMPTLLIPGQSLITELISKKARLADLSSRYTDRYPEVQRVRKEVENIEKRIEENRQSTPPTVADNQRSNALSSTMRTPQMNDEVRHMMAQIDSSAFEVSALKKEREELQKNISAVEQKIERSPRREQEMISILRDYENLKRSYDDLQKKKLEADVSQNLEKRQKGTQFRILDPANLPEDSFKPDRRKVMGIALMIAIALGFGGTIGLEMIDTTLRGVSDFKHFFQIPILACIPMIEDQQYKRTQTMRRAAVFGGIITFTLAFSIFLLVYNEKIRSILNF